jgi:hypothetical protein
MSSSIVVWSSHACFAAAATSETAPPCTTSSTVLQQHAGQKRSLLQVPASRGSCILHAECMCAGRVHAMGSSGGDGRSEGMSV